MKDFLLNLIDFRYWVMNYPYNKQLDLKLNDLMDNNAPIKVMGYYCEIGDLSLWTANFPYSYGTIKIGGQEFRPSRSTIRRLYQYVSYEFMNKQN